ncbi:MAG TPA: hypothetical protein VFF63_04490 [Candidatus Babeliales bacterium]|nr:hypothetical protein [Candidatus Babeliales bacterium]
MSRINVTPFPAIALAVAVAACSGGRPMLPGTGSQPPDALRGSHPGTFTVVRAQVPTIMQMEFLLTDGSVLAQSANDNPMTWWRYVPDDEGNYSDGTWTQAASLPSGYAPSANASDLLADGRLVIIGGEYNYPGQYDLQLVNLGAIFDPVANTWTKIGHPHRWDWIGDSPSSVLPDGRLLLGQKLTERDAYLNPKTLQWTRMKHTGKADFNAEEGWSLLANGTILTADVLDAPNSEIYDPSKQQWTTAGSTIVDLRSPSPFHYCLTYGPKPKDCYLPPGEIGPSILRPDGTVFYTGSGTGPSGTGVGNTSIYNSKTGTWTAGPQFPDDDNAGDSWAMLEPSGNVLVFGLAGGMYEWNGTTFTKIGTWSGPPILLPTGQIMMCGYSSIVLYTPTGSPNPSWAPTIKNYPSTISAGQTYKISGTQFNGLGQAMSFGDEYQNATNYPLVRITNNASGHVYYAHTHDVSTMGVATGSKKVSTYFDVPATIATGGSTLEVVANGIASKPVNVTVSGSRR